MKTHDPPGSPELRMSRSASLVSMIAGDSVLSREAEKGDHKAPARRGRRSPTAAQPG